MKMSAAYLLLTVAMLSASAFADVPIPNKPLGFVYKNASHSAPIHIDVFLDLACPDSKMAFPVMKQVADAYTDKSVRVKFLLFPLPYHRNSHLSAIGAQAVYNNPIAKHSPDDSVIMWMQDVFATQSSWSDSATKMDNLGQIKTLIASYSASLGFDPETFEMMLAKSDYDWAARVEWKYGCSRGVAGTPWYFVNGVNVAADASWNLAKWKTIIDSLLKGRTLYSNL